MLLKEIFGVLSSCQPCFGRRCKSQESERAVKPGFIFLQGQTSASKGFPSPCPPGEGPASPSSGGAGGKAREALRRQEDLTHFVGDSVPDALRQEVNQPRGSAGGAEEISTAAAVTSEPPGLPCLTLRLLHLWWGPAGCDRPGPRVPSGFLWKAQRELKASVRQGREMSPEHKGGPRSFSFCHGLPRMAGMLRSPWVPAELP